MSFTKGGCVKEFELQAKNTQNLSLHRFMLENHSSSLPAAFGHMKVAVYSETQQLRLRGHSGCPPATGGCLIYIFTDYLVLLRSSPPPACFMWKQSVLCHLLPPSFIVSLFLSLSIVHSLYLVQLACYNKPTAMYRLWYSVWLLSWAQRKNFTTPKTSLRCLLLLALLS